MQQFFETKVTRKVQTESGKVKTIKETYLVDACSPTEAEARLIGNLPDGERSVTAAKLTNISHALMIGKNSEDSTFFRVKIVYHSEEEGKIKHTPQYLIVEGDGPQEALRRVQGWLANEVLDYSIDTIMDSKMAGVVLVGETA